MKQYLLGFLGAWVLSFAVTLGMTVAALAGWLFTGTPLWFDLLFFVVTALPYIIMGERVARRTRKQAPHRGLWPLLGLMALWALGTAGVDDVVLLLTMPGRLFAMLLSKLLSLGGFWEGLWILAGHLLLPLLYHLGWHWGKD